MILVIGYANYEICLDRRILSVVIEMAYPTAKIVERMVSLGSQIESEVYLIAALGYMDYPKSEKDAIREQMRQAISDLNSSYGRIISYPDLDETERLLLTKLDSPLWEFDAQALQIASIPDRHHAFGVVMVRSAGAVFEEYGSRRRGYVVTSAPKVLTIRT